jgi:hypothetical protein
MMRTFLSADLLQFGVIHSSYAASKNLQVHIWLLWKNGLSVLMFYWKKKLIFWGCLCVCSRFLEGFAFDLFLSFIDCDIICPLCWVNCEQTNWHFYASVLWLSYSRLV